MSIPAVPNSTCEVTYIENGVISTDGLPAVVVGFFHPEALSNMVPMTSMCAYHYQILNPRQLSRGVWSFQNLAAVNSPISIRNPNTQAPPKLKDHRAAWVINS